jgi:hypothetical protein
MPAAVYWAIIRPESTPGSSARKCGRPRERLASSARSMRRSAMEARSAVAIGEEVAHVPDRGAVEVAVGGHLAVGGDHGVVDGAGELTLGDEPRVVDGVARGTGDLWRAAQRVGVLDERAAGPLVAGHDG